jgi:hypothetical protein
LAQEVPAPSFEETKLSSEHGNTAAQAILVGMYANGEGVPQDWLLALDMNVEKIFSASVCKEGNECDRKRKICFNLAIGSLWVRGYHARRCSWHW